MFLLKNNNIIGSKEGKEEN